MNARTDTKQDQNAWDSPLIIRSNDQLQRLKQGYKEQAATAMLTTLTIGAAALVALGLIALAFNSISLPQFNTILACSLYFCAIALIASMFQAR